MRSEIIAELATAHGGDLALAEEMIRVAADCGVDWVKTQAFQVKHLRKGDPQAAWFAQSELSVEAHARLASVARSVGVKYLTTVFTMSDCVRLSNVKGIGGWKIGSGEGGGGLADEVMVHSCKRPVFVSLPWGRGESPETAKALSTVPLYPMPPECYRVLQSVTGWHADA